MSILLYFLIPATLISFIVVFIISIKEFNKKLNFDLLKKENLKKSFESSNNESEKVNEKLFLEIQKIIFEINEVKHEIAVIKEIIKHSYPDKLIGYSRTRTLSHILSRIESRKSLDYSNELKYEITPAKKKITEFISNDITNN